jgi:hypothetical protein
VQLFRLLRSAYQLFRAYQQRQVYARRYPRAPGGRRWLGRSLGAAIILGFLLLTWVRAESLTRMMPHLVDLGLGVLAGIIGNSLGYWLGLLGLAPAPACTASQTLKLVQIVGVPVAYVLLGGHMLLLPVTGACIAAALVVLTRWLGWTSCPGHR